MCISSPIRPMNTARRAAAAARCRACRVRRAAERRAWPPRAALDRALRQRTHVLDCVDVRGNAGRPARARACARRGDRESAARPRCAGNLALKWPNDLLHDGRKLGGLLTRATAGSRRCSHRRRRARPQSGAAGRGAPRNRSVGPDVRSIIRLRSPVTDLASAILGRPPSRNASSRHVSSSVSRKHFASSQPGATPALPETGPRARCASRYAGARCTRAATGSRAPPRHGSRTGRCSGRERRARATCVFG